MRRTERWKGAAMIVFNLDKLLAHQKLRSNELAREIGCTEQTISKIKTGKVKALRMTTLDTLCERFGCQPGDILEYVTEEEAVARFGEDFVHERQQFLAS